MSRKHVGVVQRCPRNCPNKGKCRRHKWAFVLELPPGRDGKRHIEQQSGFETAKDAADAREEAKQRWNGTARETTADERRQTVGEFLENWYADRQAASELKVTTAKGYRSHMDLYLIPHLGHIKLRDLRGQDIDRMILKIKAGGARKPLSDATIQRVLATLRTAMSEAVTHGLIPVNPVSRSTRKPKKVRSEKVDPWTSEELAEFLAFIADDKTLANLTTVAALTGLRRGELAGLEWDAIDMEAGTITVKRTLVDLSAKGVLPDTPKSEASQRTVQFGSVVAEALRSQKLAHPFSRSVFVGATGEALRPNHISDAFQRAVERAGRDIGLRRCRLHDLRHYAATVALAAGVPLATVQYRLGHANSALTADLYGHLVKSADREAADRIEAALKAAR
jgi:integrase